MQAAAASRDRSPARGALAVGLLCLAVAGCAAGDPTVDPTSVARTGRPNDWLICPPASCRFAPDVPAPTFAADPAAVAAAWRQAIAAAPRTRIVHEDAADHRLVAEQRSLVFRFVDTIAVEALALPGGRSSYAAYSRSNIGWWDLGVNRRRLTRWAAEVERTLGEGR